MQSAKNYMVAHSEEWRNHIAAVFSVELDVVFHIEWLATAIALVGTAVLATATGWAASFRILGQKPLQVLREE